MLPEEEARHAVKVLRARPGDEVVAVDGLGGWFRVRLDVVDKRTATGTVVETQREVGEPGYDLTVGLGVLKNTGRFETFVEKAVELGVRRVIPLVTERTEAERLKPQRLQNLLIAAMKQSGRSFLPELAAPTPLAEVLSYPGRTSLLCHESATVPILSLLPHPIGACSVLVGPEGGFSEGEVVQARERGWNTVSLGQRRLRAETAGITVCAAVQLAYGAGA